eukprot:4299354-Amphidinium_carterae.1
MPHAERLGVLLLKTVGPSSPSKRKSQETTLNPSEHSLSRLWEPSLASFAHLCKGHSWQLPVGRLECDFCVASRSGDEALFQVWQAVGSFGSQDELVPSARIRKVSTSTRADDASRLSKGGSFGVHLRCVLRPALQLRMAQNIVRNALQLLQLCSSLSEGPSLPCT